LRSLQVEVNDIRTDITNEIVTFRCEVVLAGTEDIPTGIVCTYTGVKTADFTMNVIKFDPVVYSYVSFWNNTGTNRLLKIIPNTPTDRFFLNPQSGVPDYSIQVHSAPIRVDDTTLPDNGGFVFGNHESIIFSFTLGDPGVSLMPTGKEAFLYDFSFTEVRVGW
jgi:hypothetical protein